jgi:hypothetical protein
MPLFTASRCVAIAALAAVGIHPAMSATTVSFPTPTVDRWMYAFNENPGAKTTGRTFGAPLLDGFDDFDGQFIVGYETGSQIPIGQGPGSYLVESVKLVLTIANDNAFVYDPSYDALDTIEDDSLDSDDGRPAYLFGLSYRSGFSVETWVENSPYAVDPPVVEPAQGHRTAYPTDLGGGEARDVSNYAKDGFEPVPWAVGTSDLAPGDSVPMMTEFTFDLDLDNPLALAYVQESLDLGTLNFAIVAPHPAFGGSQAYPTYFTREAGTGAARLEIVLADDVPGDLNGDGNVDLSDLGILLASFEIDGGGDLDGDGDTDLSDLGILLANFQG